MRAVTIVTLAVAVGLALAVAPFASSAPDGLGRVAAEHGFAGEGRLHAVQEDAPVRDYAFPGVADERLATGLAGFAGTLVAFGLGSGVARLGRRRDHGADPAAGAS